jgi:hypothetical protein
MNERIKEIGEKAGLFMERQHPGGFPNEELSVAYKFAELIIRDCYSVIIKSQRGHFNPATSWDAVKQHFGVKE